MRIIFLTIYISFLLLKIPAFAQNDIKNVIVMIPDGTSVDLLALARWYNGNVPLTLDSLICGLMKTHSADNTIADSAPAGTAIATGSKSKAGYVGVDSLNRALYSVLELSRDKGMSTGVVVTCQFPHATPADFVCHYIDRDDYPTLTRQFIANSPDVVFAGGFVHIKDTVSEMRKVGFKVINDYTEFLKFDFSKSYKQPVWALFNDYRGGDKAMSFDCDRNPATEPSLAEMTEKAIQYLSQNKKGFFLMVEGSQVDWAAHSNDPKAAITDFLAFDKAVGVSVAYADKSKNTLVIVCPDHGNGGISMGNKVSSNSLIPEKYYDNLYIESNVVSPLIRAKHSSRWLADSLQKIDMSKTNYAQIIEFVEKEYAVRLSELEAAEMMGLIAKYNKLKKISGSGASEFLSKATVMLGHKLSEKSFIGWTTTGHTGEDVFLGIYPHRADNLRGIVDNTDIAKFIARVLNLGTLPRYKN